MPRNSEKSNLESSGFTPDVLRESARALLATLDERTRRILEARFGLSTGEPMTLQAVGDVEHLTRERIRQVEAAGMRRIRSAVPTAGAMARVREALPAALRSLGGAALEDTLLAAVGGRNGRDRAVLRFLLSVLPGLQEASETKRTFVHWALTGPGADGGGARSAWSVETVLEAAEHILEEARAMVPEPTFLRAVGERVGGEIQDAALRSLLAIGKRTVRTPLAEWGFRGWPEATPRSAGDKAYIVLKRAGKPLHFSQIAEAMNAMRFDAKRAHAQTVHNELIRSTRFVLVGRGIYALREWGFEAGTVADVLVRILAAARKPLSKNELLEAVLAQRLVKRNTVLLALQNRSLFRILGDGTYALAAPSKAAGLDQGGPAPRESRGPGGPPKEPEPPAS